MRRHSFLYISIFLCFLSSCGLLYDDEYRPGFWVLIDNNTGKDGKIFISVEESLHGKSKIRTHTFDLPNNKKLSTFAFNLDDYEGEFYSSNYFNILSKGVYNKHFVVTTISGDTLANWNDSSAVFTQQYWLIEHQESGDLHCTLQLTDEVLKLK